MFDQLNIGLECQLGYLRKSLLRSARVVDFTVENYILYISLYFTKITLRCHGVISSQPYTYAHHPHDDSHISFSFVARMGSVPQLLYLGIYSLGNVFQYLTSLLSYDQDVHECRFLR